jgi:hypothetical protein
VAHQRFSQATAAALHCCCCKQTRLVLRCCTDLHCLVRPYAVPAAVVHPVTGLQLAPPVRYSLVSKHKVASAQLSVQCLVKWPQCKEIYHA